MRSFRSRQNPKPDTQNPRSAGTVSAIEPQERRGGQRSNVYLDGRYAFSLTTELAIVRKSGAFFSYGDTRLGQGRENAKDFLRKNVEIRDEIERLIRSQTLTPRVAVTAPVDGENGVVAESELVDAF